MHGMFWVSLERFVKEIFGSEVWCRVHHAAGLPLIRYVPTRAYPDDDLVLLVEQLAQITGQPRAETLENLGLHMAPQLLTLASLMIRTEESTLSVLAMTDDVMHRIVRLRQPSSHPPALTCIWRSKTEMEVMYGSHRKLCALAKGIIRGIAQCFQEEIVIVERSCILKGDPYCCLVVSTGVAGEQRPGIVYVPEGGYSTYDVTAETKWLEASPERDRSCDWLPRPVHAGDISQLAHYRVLRKIGEGGMAVVFLAEDTQLMRQVALKVLKPEIMSQPEAQRQFLREARALGRLIDDHIVPVYGIYEEGGLSFLVMPLLEGETLRQWMSHGEPLYLRQVVRVAEECALGLSAAHQKQLIHRDIKPANIWLEQPKSRVRLMDFGLALSPRDSSRLMQPGLFAGTCQYMAPEQVGEARPVAQIDLYSLGVVLYELCSGHLPLDAENTLQMVHALLTKEPQPLCDLNPRVPADLASLIMQMLAKDPERRPKSAAEVASRITILKQCLGRESKYWREIVIRERIQNSVA